MCNVKREEFHQQHVKSDLCRCNPINHVTEKTLGSPMWYRVTGVVPILGNRCLMNIYDRSS
jgi:hypothetical protein